MENDTINLIRPFYYSYLTINQARVMKIKGCRLIEINGEKHLELPLGQDRFLFIPAEGLVKIESNYESTK